MLFLRSKRLKNERFEIFTIFFCNKYAQKFYNLIDYKRHKSLHLFDPKISKALCDKGFARFIVYSNNIQKTPMDYI